MKKIKCLQGNRKVSSREEKGSITWEFQLILGKQIRYLYLVICVITLYYWNKCFRI